MQFVRNGPDIPDTLLRAHEEGKLVFFCGAGISTPAGLPGFGALTETIFSKFGARTDIENSAISECKYDTAFGLLERRVGDRHAVRIEVQNALTPDPPLSKISATHDALLTLGTVDHDKCRLVTTNFDRLFEEAQSFRKLQCTTYKAPLLPVPKSRWNGIVYLHGLLENPGSADDLNRLVLSSGDFGLAYLQERWASRFVTDLFKHYTVCFIGYSISDPVLRYMMDALAADQLLGEAEVRAYAFASHGDCDSDKVYAEWAAKNVTPILYSSELGHSALHRTLESWASTFRDGFLGKERIAATEGLRDPRLNTTADDFVSRVCWAISDPSGLPAKAFSELDPVPILAWLEVFTETKYRHEHLELFNVTPNRIIDTDLKYSIFDRPTAYTHAPKTRIVYHDSAMSCRYDPAFRHLSRWLARHAQDPELILWIARNGPVLHPMFALDLEDALKSATISPAMKSLWEMVLAGLLSSRSTYPNIYTWIENFNKTGLTFSLKIQLKHLLAPRVTFTTQYLPELYIKAQHSPQKISEIVHAEIALQSEYVHSAFKQLKENTLWNDALPSLLSDFTELLYTAMSLANIVKEAGPTWDYSIMYQPSISDHSQNSNLYDWTVLINLCRDAILRAAESNPALARLELQRWLLLPSPVFKRLAFYSMSVTSLLNPDESVEALLSENAQWLWSVHTLHEALGLLMALMPQVSQGDHDRLFNAILTGPPKARFLYGSTSPEEAAEADHYQIWLRLKVLENISALPPNAAQALTDLSSQYPDWVLLDGDESLFPMYTKKWQREDQMLPTPSDLDELVKWLTENPDYVMGSHDNWRDRCIKDFKTTVSALQLLANEDKWYPYRWAEALHAWREDDEVALMSWHAIGTYLETAPQAALRDMGVSIGWWLETMGRLITTNESRFLTIVKRLIGSYRNDPYEHTDDFIFHSINHALGAGSQALLFWWQRYKFSANPALDKQAQSILQDISNTNWPAYRHARINLGRFALPLYTYVQDWSRAQLLPRFDWRYGDEALIMWTGFLNGSYYNLTLIEEIKVPFLESAEKHSTMGKAGQGYVSLLTQIALSPQAIFTDKELKSAIESLPDEGLEQLLHELARLTVSTKAEQLSSWAERVLDFIKSYFPPDRGKNSTEIAESFAELCVVSGPLFPQFVNMFQSRLVPYRNSYSGLHAISESELPTHYPIETLTYLKKVVGSNDGTMMLRTCLNKIKGSLSDPLTNPTYREMDGKCRSVDL